MRECAICGSNIIDVMDLGPQPICSRYLSTPDDNEYLHLLIIGQCEKCRVIQLVDPIPASELKPRFDWITYNEPEGHLDDLAGVIADLPGIKNGSRVSGTSYKDNSLLKRLSDKGMKAVENNGKADVVIARHIVEHMYDPLAFIEKIKKRLSPGGFLVLEAPDFRPSLDKYDYSTIWEEHLFYFTRETFQGLFGFSGMFVQYFNSIPYMLENAMVGIGKIGDQKIKASAKKEQISGYINSFEQKKSELRRTLSGFRKKKGKIAVFGSGHLACTFVNLFGLKDLVEFFADDNPHKQGLFMPGSHLPILSSGALIEKEIKLGLLSVSFESEGKVIKNNAGFTKNGGSFASIFPASSMALKTN